MHLDAGAADHWISQPARHQRLHGFTHVVVRPVASRSGPQLPADTVEHPAVVDHAAYSAAAAESITDHSKSVRLSVTPVQEIKQNYQIREFHLPKFINWSEVEHGTQPSAASGLL